MENHQTPADFGKGPQGEVRRWLMELRLADKREKDWRELGKKIWDRYRGKGRKRNSFNILWSNTETLAPAVFNSPPQPNVRRRFKDADPVGKVVSEVLERCLSFQTDTEHFMTSVGQDVLDMLLPGRGVSRIRYVPSLVQVGTPVPNEGAEKYADEAMEGDTEELAWEQTVTEHVQWDDFRHGPGKTWSEVGWEGFRHRMTKQDLVNLCGEEMASCITLDEPADDDLKKDDELCEVFQTAEVWEIWDKDARKVRFVCATYRDNFLKVVDDPLGLAGFFPNPKPLYAIQDSASLDPIPLYEQYKEQAQELDRISNRINKIIDAMKVRGLYDSTLAELSDLLRGDDNDLVPVQNAAMWAEKGGLEKAIWMMPIKDAAAALAVLYQQREATKQVIYEITGIADVMRGSTDPNETLGAQQLKAQWGGQRVQSLQREVQRYARDIIRLMAEIAGEKFQPETLLKMSGLTIPTQAQVRQQMMQMQQAQATGQPPQMPQQPPVLLEQVMQVLRDDATRMFKVDVETDSMVAATMQQDMQAMEQVLGGITQLVTGLGPAVQSGAMPVEAVKEMILAVSRRAKLGSLVEDALDKIKAPNPQSDPNQAKVEAQNRLAEQKQMHDQQIAQRQQAHEQMAAQREQQHAEQMAAIEQRREQDRLAMEERLNQQKLVMDQAAAERELQQKERLAMMEAQMERWGELLKARTAIEVAEIGANTTVQTAQISAAASATEAE